MRPGAGGTRGGGDGRGAACGAGQDQLTTTAPPPRNPHKGRDPYGGATAAHTFDAPPRHGVSRATGGGAVAPGRGRAALGRATVRAGAAGSRTGGTCTIVDRAEGEVVPRARVVRAGHGPPDRRRASGAGIPAPVGAAAAISHPPHI